jgi:hypothetical protein
MDLSDHRKLRFDSSRSLNAGLVLSTIDQKFSSVVPGLGKIGEVSILTEQSSTARHMQSYYYNEEVVCELMIHDCRKLFSSCRI